MLFSLCVSGEGGGVGFMCMHFRIYFNNFSNSDTVCTSDLLAWWDVYVCVCVCHFGLQKLTSLYGSSL